LGKEDKEFLNLQPELDCGNKKDYNPITKSCVSKCKDNKIRNENFSCVTPLKISIITYDETSTKLPVTV
jgi:hypothetical protein